MTKYYIVWNSSKTEGFITNNPFDSEACYMGELGGVASTVGEHFFECYCEDELHQQIVEL